MKRGIDKTRASRDGHEYHEAWTARKALQLLWPNHDLCGISVEGLSPNDESHASKATVEIADITLYFGKAPSFKHGAFTQIAQFKYSISSKDKDFRASNAKKTITKFAKTFKDYKRTYDTKSVSDRLEFQLITNQPIYKPLIKTIEMIAKGLPQTGEIKKQGDQFIKAAGLGGKQLTEFAAKVEILGRTSDLRTIKDELENLIVDWSATSDPLAHERLGRLKALIRDKAGSAGAGQNLITRPDILNVLKVSDSDDLLPCKPRLINVGPVVEREQLTDALKKIHSTSKPVLIHADGGVGKTVFMESLEHKLKEDSEVVFFDCFGGGAYRSIDDSRHLAKQGLIHIANTLSFRRGLCDPMLPESLDQQTLMRTFRRRIGQCIQTMVQTAPNRKLVLLIDAIDNADIVAKDRNENAFPVKLLESLDGDAIDGFKVIVSCRSHRKPSTYAKYDDYKLHPFTIAETRTFLRSRLKDVTEREINVAQARSGGNPRILDHLLRSGRGLLDQSEINKPIVLDDLIQQQIDDAIAAAHEKGSDKKDIDAFLAGLSVLPPPVPLDEYAGAHGIDLSAVKSFASDMAALLERTNQGITFKDEPTETLISERYASSITRLKSLADNLFSRQDSSVYAARSLPGLLHKLDDGKRLFKLAFDIRIPSSITSTVGKRNIRYARLKAATFHASQKADFDRLVRLLVELSTIAAVDQRGAQYLLAHPDLVVAAQDDDATRRLFEIRSGWPGSRHASLVIANILAGDFNEASRHALKTHEWIQHANRDSEKWSHQAGPGRQDIAAIPFFLITDGKVKRAISYMEGWYDWYAFEVYEHIFDCSYFAQSIGMQSKQHFTDFIDCLTKTGHIAAALSFCTLSKSKSK